MKFLHLSDLHIGIRVNEMSMLPDQEHILAQIIDIAAVEKPDAVIIAGDIYDKTVPPAEGVASFRPLFNLPCRKEASRFYYKRKPRLRRASCFR